MLPIDASASAAAGPSLASMPTSRSSHWRHPIGDPQRTVARVIAAFAPGFVARREISPTISAVA
jgi:hypothetical protein